MTTRDRTMVLVLALAALVAAGWFLVLAPMRDEAGSLSSQIDTQRQTLDAALADVAAGTQARHRYAHDYATVARLGAAVPEDDNVASLLVQVQHAAGASDVDFRALKVGGGSGAAAPAPPPPTAPTDGTAAATQATTATLPPGALVGPAGFPTMPFAFTFTGDFFHMSTFIGRLERFLVVRNQRLSVSGRFMTIDGIGLNAAADGFPRIEAAVAATTYLLPATQGLTDGATAAGPATATPASASSGAPSSIPAATATPVTR
ncbi:MAG TPA: type II secretion system protein GspM [Conexibacter sp.]|jgi:hypothetical protein|nr:type II secretion system protein GspM [Conexibacter sp.]